MAASEPKGHGQHAGMWVFPDAATTSQDLSEKTASMPQRFTIALLLTGLLFIVGIVGFVARAADDGFDEIAPWGYYMAVFSLVFMISSGAPLVVVAFRFTKSHWRRPISRIGELFSIVCILNLLMFIPLMFLLPGLENPEGVVEGQLELRRTIWFEGPIGAPHAWDLLGVAFLAITSLAILVLHATYGFQTGLASTVSADYESDLIAKLIGTPVIGLFLASFPRAFLQGVEPLWLRLPKLRPKPDF